MEKEIPSEKQKFHKSPRVTVNSTWKLNLPSDKMIQFWTLDY